MPADSAVDAHLVAARERYLAFVRSRLADPDLAEDVLQDAIVRAIAAAPAIDGEQQLSAWFYRVLRNAVTDTYRRSAVRSRRLTTLDDSIDPPAPLDDADDQALCECFRVLVPTLKPEYSDILLNVDLGGETPAAAAERLGLTSSNFKVRRHRARQALRRRLDETCRLCAQHGCLDCTCEEDARQV